jgi:subtilase family serine protease
VNQNGSTTSVPRADGGWAQEISLDVEWAHAIAPAANILLVEANSNSLSDLLAAVDYAAAHASVVSMSWGSSEFASELSYDSHFNASGVTFVASSGDSGGVQEWPAVSPSVLSVGGTSLALNADGSWKSESGWSGSGGGTSAYEARPSYQGGLSFSNRSSPDVAYNADPNTGVAVYDSYRFQGRSGWMVFGGTSAGAPQWAALIGIANAGRATPLDGRSQTLEAIYNGQVLSGHFHDITSGQTSSSILAGPGYDQITGMGSPFSAQSIIDDLILV